MKWEVGEEIAYLLDPRDALHGVSHKTERHKLPPLPPVFHLAYGITETSLVYCDGCWGGKPERQWKISVLPQTLNVGFPAKFDFCSLQFSKQTRGKFRALSPVHSLHGCCLTLGAGEGSRLTQ